MQPGWKLLEGLEVPLLIRGEFGASNYSIWLTDLKSVWAESLERKSIIKRAFEIDASVDPSEDASQMHLLLSSIQRAVNDEAGTRMTFSSSNHSQQIAIEMSINLSISLPDLQWKSSLSKCSPSFFTQKIVIPLLAAQLNAQIERESLLSQIRDKDVNIAKLINQMQADGSDFSKIFPGSISSKLSTKPNVREALGKHIHGIGEFSEDEWRSHVREKMTVPAHLENMLARINVIEFAESWESFPMPDVTPWNNLGRHSLPSRTISDAGRDAAQVGGKEEEEKSVDMEDDAEDTGFQKQITPPKSKQQPSRHSTIDLEIAQEPANADSGETTTDDEDDHSFPRKIARTSPKLVSDDRPAERTPEEPTRAVEITRRSAENSPSELTQPEKIRSKSSTACFPSPEVYATRSKPKIGKIGGKKKTEGPINLERSGREPKLNKEPSLSKSTKNHEDGELSGQLATTDETPRGRAKATSAQIPYRGETSQERADRNRERLKRELEKGQMGKPKRRKF